MLDEERETLRRTAYGRPPAFADAAAADAWSAEAARARMALAELERPGPDAATAPDADERRRPVLRTLSIRSRPAALVALAAGGILAGGIWLATPHYPEPLPGNELPAGYAGAYGLDHVQNLVNWRDWSVMVARSHRDPDRECLIFARDGGHGFTCREGVLHHDMYAGERADVTWDPGVGLTLEADGETTTVPYRLPD